MCSFNTSQPLPKNPMVLWYIFLGFFHVVNQRLQHGEVLKLDLESDRTKLQKRSMEPTFFDRMLLVPERIEQLLMERLKIGDPNVRIVIFGKDHPLLPSADELAERAGSIQGQSEEIEILSYPYLCTVDFLHRYSETLSPYEFSCEGFIETTYSILELKEMAAEPSSPGASSEPVDTLTAASASEGVVVTQLTRIGPRVEGTLAKTRVEQGVLANLDCEPDAAMYAERGAKSEEREEVGRGIYFGWRKCGFSRDRTVKRKCTL